MVDALRLSTLLLFDCTRFKKSACEGAEGIFISAWFKSPLAPLLQRGECFVISQLSSNERFGIKPFGEKCRVDKRSASTFLSWHGGCAALIHPTTFLLHKVQKISLRGGGGDFHIRARVKSPPRPPFFTRG